MGIASGGVPNADRIKNDANASLAGQKEKQRKRQEFLALIDRRRFERECIVRSIVQSHPRLVVEAYGSVSEWEDALDVETTGTLVLYNVGVQGVSDPAVAEEVRRLVDIAGDTPVVVLGQSEDIAEMIAAIEGGARGYIPSSIGIDFIVEATRLTSVGGVFLPTAAALALRSAIPGGATEGLDAEFTPRQEAVARAVWRGKANKIIAYELSMCESTVKIHIRNILKKLAVSNRTEAAFKLNARYARASFT